MPSDRFAKCPVCAVKRASEAASAMREAESNYVVIPLAMYRELLSKAEELRKPLTAATLREDRWIGITEDGVFAVRYSAVCQRCNWSFEYRYEDAVVKSTTAS